MKQNIENITNKDIDTVNERITTLRNKRKLYINDYNKKMEEFEQEMFKLYEEKYSVDNVINKLLCNNIEIYDKGYDEKYTSWYTLMSQNDFSIQKTLNKLFDYNKNYRIDFQFFVPVSKKIRINSGFRYIGQNVNITIKLDKLNKYYLSNLSFVKDAPDDVYFDEIENNPNIFSFNDDIEKLVDRIVSETNQECIYALIKLCKD